MKGTTGITKTAHGWRAFVRVHGRLYSKCFTPETHLATMRRWRETTRLGRPSGRALTVGAGETLRERVRRYLPQVATMPTLRDREDDLMRWIVVLGGDTLASDITSGVIRAQLETWRADGYAASTCNHRRTALMHLWSVLDGKTAPNPARDVPRYRETLGPPRALSSEAVALLLALMPPSQTRARLTLLAWTGWPPAQIAKLTPEAIRWNEAVYLDARGKGKGVAGSWLPLLPAAWDALREFKRLGCWGPFSTSSARQSLRRAAKKAVGVMLPLSIYRELADVTPYQFRHSFGTLVAAITQDDRAVQQLLQHADIRMTHRYTQATADPRVVAAIALVRDALGRKVTSAPVEVTPPAKH